MKEYIGEIIGALAVIIAAIIGLFAKCKNHNKQIVRKSKDSTIYQANGSISVSNKNNKTE